jgi:hypothetical protein
MALAALAVLPLAACSKPAAKQAREGLESLHSWARSSSMVGEEWVRRAVPDAYARKALQSFGEHVRKEEQKASSGELPTALARFLADGFAAVSQATDSLRSAVERKDRHATVAIMARLSAQSRAADSVKKRLGGK